MTIAELKQLKESEDKVEFKEAKRNYPFNGGSHTSQDERRKCFLGYVVAMANEGGGMLVLGMADKHPPSSWICPSLNKQKILSGWWVPRLRD
jgi:ATP-dependent DNA helicase RecG